MTAHCLHGLLVLGVVPCFLVPPLAARRCLEREHMGCSLSGLKPIRRAPCGRGNSRNVKIPLQVPSRRSHTNFQENPDNKMVHSVLNQPATRRKRSRSFPYEGGTLRSFAEATPIVNSVTESINRSLDRGCASVHGVNRSLTIVLSQIQARLMTNCI